MECDELIKPFQRVQEPASKYKFLPAEDMPTGCGSRILPGTETQGAFALATGSLNIRHVNVSYPPCIWNPHKYHSRIAVEGTCNQSIKIFKCSCIQLLVF
jgi:hypothetical protein